MTNDLSLPMLEQLVAEDRCAEALQTVLNILRAIDSRAGRLDDVTTDAIYPGGSEEDIAVVFATRFAAVLGHLLTKQELSVTPIDYERLLSHHRWIDLIFSLSGFRTSDNFVRFLPKDAGNGQIIFEGANFLRLLPLLTMNSFINIDLDQFWRANPVAAAIAFFNYISSRYVFSPRALECRERLLEWIPARLDEVKLGSMTLARVPEVYMHCSYAFTPKKHAIKRALMEQMRRACQEAGVVEATAPITARTAGRATVIVVGEHFSPGHAVFRTHSRAVRSLRQRFNLIGVIHPNPIATPIAQFFDECIEIPGGDFLTSVRAVAAQITERKPALILYLGIGMVPTVIAIASLRLAPIQCVSFGHTASSMSPAIDYFMLPEDFVGSVECFSEKILALPQAAMPFEPRRATAIRRPRSERTVRVAIPASTMKLNSVLLDAVARIAAGAKARVAFATLTNDRGSNWTFDGISIVGAAEQATITNSRGATIDEEGTSALVALGGTGATITNETGARINGQGTINAVAAVALSGDATITNETGARIDLTGANALAAVALDGDATINNETRGRIDLTGLNADVVLASGNATINNFDGAHWRVRLQCSRLPV